jgi:hypothetical protein
VTATRRPRRRKFLLPPYGDDCPPPHTRTDAERYKPGPYYPGCVPQAFSLKEIYTIWISLTQRAWNMGRHEGQVPLTITRR